MPEILADAAYLIFIKPAREFTGRFLIDDTFLAENCVTEFDRYRVDPTQDLAVDFFVPDDSVAPTPLAPSERVGARRARVFPRRGTQRPFRRAIPPYLPW